MGKILIKGLLPIIILVAGLAIGGWLYLNPEEARKRPPPEAQALLVETGQPELGDYVAKVEAMGQVMPATEAALKPQVSGEIISVDDEFIPGGFFSEGDNVIYIDPTDYELAVSKQVAVLKQAEAEYQLEMGRQSVARDELKILERTTGKKPDNPDLALRKPQLDQAAAQLDIMRADLNAVKLDLDRTNVKAPFNALVTSRSATLGDKVSSGETLATLASTDEYWVEIAVPVNDIVWLNIPRGTGDHGSKAKIVLDGGRGERSGHLVKLTGSLDENSRLANILVSVPDPLGLENEKLPALILSDYVRVELDGRKLENVMRVPLAWMHDGNVLWVKEDGKMVFKQVTPVYEDKKYAYIAEGLDEGASIVTSTISVPVEGMKIRTKDETPPQKEKPSGEGKGRKM